MGKTFTKINDEKLEIKETSERIETMSKEELLSKKEHFENRLNEINFMLEVLK